MRVHHFWVATASLATAFLLVVFGALSPSHAKAYLNAWDLVDSGKHLDVDGNSAYMSHIWKGQKTWNGHKPGVIRKDSALVIQDVYVKDVNKMNTVTASTYKSGKIEFNTYNVKNLTSTRRTNVATHELGHALGLGHSTSADVMHTKTTTRTALSSNDKDSYNAAYKKY